MMTSTKELGLAAWERGDLCLAARLLLPWARQGDAEARKVAGSILSSRRDACLALCRGPEPTREQEARRLRAEALGWTRAAADAGDREAARKLLMPDLLAPDWREDPRLVQVLRWAEEGDAESAWSGGIVLVGAGRRRPEAEALAEGARWLARAGDLGHTLAAWCLADMISGGRWPRPPRRGTSPGCGSPPRGGTTSRR